MLDVMNGNDQKKSNANKALLDRDEGTERGRTSPRITDL